MDITDYKQDPFTYITIEYYTPKKFYGVIINISALKKSTIGYGQYFAYKATNNNINIDTTQTRAVNIQFSISLTVLAHRFFIYLIAPKNQFVSTPIRPITDRKQDPFIYITIERYTPKEFYGVIINISTSKKSIIGYRQYFAYKTIVNGNININTI